MAEKEDQGEAGPEPAPLYPMTFLKVLFSFKGRINRSVFWLRGFLAIIAISLSLNALILGVRSMFAVGEMGAVHVSVIRAALKRATKRGVAFGDTFLMPLEHRDRSDHEAVLKRCLSNIEGGITHLSLHASTPGDVQDVHPNDAAWRLGEYTVLRDQAFQDWLSGMDIDVVGVRWLRDRLRNGISPD